MGHPRAPKGPRRQHLRATNPRGPPRGTQRPPMGHPTATQAPRPALHTYVVSMPKVSAVNHLVQMPHCSSISPSCRPFSSSTDPACVSMASGPSGAASCGQHSAGYRRQSPHPPPRYVPHVPSDPSRSRFRSPQQQRRRPPARPPPCKATNDASARLTPEPRPPSPALGPRPTRSRRRRRSVRAGRAVQRPGAPGPPLRSPPREPPLPLPPLPPPPLLLTLPRELAPSAALARFPASKGNAHGGTHVPMAAAPPTGGRREEREVTSPL